MLCVPADASPDLVCDGGAVFPSVPPFSTALLAPIAKRDGIDNNQPGFSPTKQNYAQVLQKHCGSTFRAERFVKKMMLGATCVGAPLSSGGARGGGESPPSGSRRLLQPGIWVNAEL